jgi:predicted transcriptional regulator
MTTARTERFPVTTAWIETWIAMRKLERPLSLRRIADWYGVSPAIVHRYTKEHVRTRALGGTHQRFSRKRARELEAKGWPRTKIAEYLGVTPPAITRALGPKESSRDAA